MTEEEKQKALDQLRIIAGAIGGYISAKYNVDESILVAVGSLAMVLGPMIWAWYNQGKQAKQLVAAVNAGVAANQAGAVTEPIRPVDATQIIKDFAPVVVKELQK